MAINPAAADFLSWLGKPSPRFVRAPSTAVGRHATLPAVIALRHVLAARPQPDELSQLRRQIRQASPALEALYARHDGAHLFACDDPDNEDAGLHFCAISELESEKNQIEDWFQDLPGAGTAHTDEQGRAEFHGLPPWFGSAIAFARFGDAAERLLLACSGPYEGSIFLFDHEQPRLVRIAASVELLLDYITRDPVKFICEHQGNAFHGVHTYLSG